MNKQKIALLAGFCLALTHATSIAKTKKSPKKQPEVATTASNNTYQNHEVFDGLTVKSITVEGNRSVKAEVIRNCLPYKEGDLFNCKKSADAIGNITKLGYFRQVRLEGAKIDTKSMHLFIVVEEKKLLETIDFIGNKAIRTKKLREKLKIDKITTIDEETLRLMALAIKKMYREENKHLVQIEYKLTPSTTSPDKASAEFIIHEGPKSLIKHVKFTGNKHIQDRKLSSIIYTRENWLLSFMDSAGTYNPEMLEMDKHRLEYFYRDNGYLMAKVGKSIIDYSPNKKDISVTFHISEGHKFFVKEISIVGDEVYNEEELKPLVTLETDEPFSQTKLVGSMNKIKDLYGEKGYIYCDVYPQIKPNEKTKTVDVTLHVERGNKMYANRIIITGNRVTRDKVIRRQLDITEGEMVTTRKLELSQAGVEYLSFFEPNSVHWKMHRIADSQTDLEMNVQEAKTKHVNFMASYGTDQYNPKATLRGMVSVELANLFGLGWDAGGMIQADRHRLRRLETHFFDPHMFDTNISGGVTLYKRWDEYDYWHSLSKTPIQKILGADVQIGFGLPSICKNLRLIFDIGIEDIKTNNPQPRGTAAERARFSPIVDRTFQQGTLKWVGVDLVRDTRDHQIYPKSGCKIALGMRLAPPGINNQFSYLKEELEMSFYTTLIEKFIMDDALVFMLHGKVGHIGELSHKRPVPYKELFHMGGQTTIRGFLWGQVGPLWVTGDPLGARNAVQLNTELIFPLIPDYSMKAHLFYDAGSGWNTPKDGIADKTLIRHDKFDLRHAVGFGLNLTKPIPAKIDWGFKLDRKRKENESPYEFNLSMNYAW